jgi:hypothetical protein
MGMLEHSRFEGAAERPAALVETGAAPTFLQLTGLLSRVSMSRKLVESGGRIRVSVAVEVFSRRLQPHSDQTIGDLLRHVVRSSQKSSHSFHHQHNLGSVEVIDRDRHYPVSHLQTTGF